MVEKEPLRQFTRTETINVTNQDRPFKIKKNVNSWQLLVDRTHLESKGFLPSEINGAVYLEEESLSNRVNIYSRSGVEGLRNWQEVSGDDIQVSSFKQMFEKLAVLSSLERRAPEKAKAVRKYLKKISRQSSGEELVRGLFNGILNKQLELPEETDSSLITTVLENLQKKELIEGKEVSPLEALTSPDLSFSAKTAWLENRFLPRFEFLKTKDEEQREQKEKEDQNQDSQQGQDSDESQPQEQSKQQTPPTPPPVSDEFEQHRGRQEKGEGSPTFIIKPGLNGYWEEDSYDNINESTGRLYKTKSSQIKKPLTSLPQSIAGTQRTISGTSGTSKFSLPLPPSYQLTFEGYVKLTNQNIEISSDSEGHLFLQSEKSIPYETVIIESLEPKISRFKKNDTQIISNTLPGVIQQEVDRIASLPTDSMGKIEELAEFIHSNFKYPADDEVPALYAKVDNSTSRLNAMIDAKKLDCHLAREYFLTMLKRLDLSDIQWQGVNGYYSAGCQKDGTTHLHSGIAHAWVKVRRDIDKNWTIIDPTPPGDPIHKDEKSMEELTENSAGDFSEENMDQLEKEASRSEGNGNMFTPDKYILDFARDAGIDQETARKIFAEINEADKLKDNQGRNLLERLKEQFDRIIDTNLLKNSQPQRNVRMSRGQSVADPVAIFIDTKSGSLDPAGFSRKKIIEKEEKRYGGLDLEIITDGSGSMKEPLGGKVKYIVQRQMSYLLHRGLHRFSREAQRMHLRLTTPLKIRSSQHMFRGDKIQTIKELSDKFTPKEMAQLWKKSAENIDGGTPAHLGLQAVMDKITPEDKKLLLEKKLLKVVALISDGGYDSGSVNRVNKLISELRQLNVVVAEFKITDADSLNNLPQNVAEKVIESAKALMPERVRR